MKKSPQILEAPGELIDPAQLKAEKAKQFVRYLECCGAHARFIETRSSIQLQADVVVFEVKVERPQILAHRINRTELVAAVFPLADDKSPEVLSLRADFPSVPHLNQTHDEFPRSICLYEQPFEHTRLSWTPADFFQRMHHWFAATAKGNLHAGDQPLEPLLGATNWRLILPSGFDPQAALANPSACSLYRVEASGEAVTLRTIWRNQQAGANKADSVIVAFACMPQTHGVIRRQPADLFQLNELCLDAGLDLAKQLTEAIRKWYLNKTVSGVLDAKLVLLIYLPKRRDSAGKTETVETRAFLTLLKIRELGEILGVLGKGGGMSGFIIGQQTASLEPLKKVPIAVMQVNEALTPRLAAKMNGLAVCEDNIVGIGAGALGSQVFNNLLRAGYGKWTLVDDDLLLPHNCARHFLGDWAIGTNKADAMADIGNTIFGDRALVKSIPANILSPGAHKSRIADALAQASFILDMSASVGVARHLAESEIKSKSVSVFVTPNGSSLVVMAEDKGRKCRLDWLEMLHYRAVLSNPSLTSSFKSPDARIRYGNACRDLTSELPQDCIATWAGIASRAVKTVAKSPDAALLIYSNDDLGGVTVHTEPASRPIKCVLSDWTVQLDTWLLDKLAALRVQRLPNETGGVLLGSFDTHRRVCSILDVIPSPPDSQEWPTSYIRGCEGLAEQVRSVQSQTLGQVNYVGEWHSHPNHSSTNPSSDDLKAYGWLVGHMNVESLPAIMIIVGDKKEFRLVSTENVLRSSKTKQKKK